MKRGAAHQINKDQPDACSDDEDGGEQAPRGKADAATLAQRRIVRVKRRLPGDGAEVGAEAAAVSSSAGEVRAESTTTTDEAPTNVATAGPASSLGVAAPASAAAPAAAAAAAATPAASSSPFGGIAASAAFGAPPPASDAGVVASSAPAVSSSPFGGMAASAALGTSEEAQTATSVEQGGESEVQVVTSSADFWQVQVEAVYRRRNPIKMAGVPALLEKYRGKEAALYAKVCKTYDLDPKRFYADPKAWETYEKDQEEEAKPAVSDTASGAGTLFGDGAPNLFGSGSLFGAKAEESKPAETQAPAQAECKTQ